MREIKAAFFDVDGTLLSHTLRKIPESTMEALQKLREKGILTFLATGRGMVEMKTMTVSGIPFDGYVTLNGQMCYDADLNLIYTISVEENDKKKLVKMFQEKEIPILIIEKDRMYVNFVNEDVVQVQADITSKIPQLGEYTGENVYQFVFYTNLEKAQEIVKELKETKIHYWHSSAVDFLPAVGGKAAGIEKILPFYNLKREEIMVFGDGENDIDMISYAGIGVAMGNAEEKVKAAADYVTEHIDDDGIKKALEHFGII